MAHTIDLPAADQNRVFDTPLKLAQEFEDRGFFKTFDPALHHVIRDEWCLLLISFFNLRHAMFPDRFGDKYFNPEETAFDEEVIQHVLFVDVQGGVVETYLEDIVDVNETLEDLAAKAKELRIRTETTMTDWTDVYQDIEWRDQLTYDLVNRMAELWDLSILHELKEEHQGNRHHILWPYDDVVSDYSIKINALAQIARSNDALLQTMRETAHESLAPTDYRRIMRLCTTSSCGSTIVPSVSTVIPAQETAPGAADTSIPTAESPPPSAAVTVAAEAAPPTPSTPRSTFSIFPKQFSLAEREERARSFRETYLPNSPRRSPGRSPAMSPLTMSPLTTSPSGFNIDDIAHLSPADDLFLFEEGSPPRLSKTNRSLSFPRQPLIPESIVEDSDEPDCKNEERGSRARKGGIRRKPARSEIAEALRASTSPTESEIQLLSEQPYSIPAPIFTAQGWEEYAEMMKTPRDPGAQSVPNRRPPHWISPEHRLSRSNEREAHTAALFGSARRRQRTLEGGLQPLSLTESLERSLAEHEDLQSPSEAREDRLRAREQQGAMDVEDIPSSILQGKGKGRAVSDPVTEPQRATNDMNISQSFPQDKGTARAGIPSIKIPPIRKLQRSRDDENASPLLPRPRDKPNGRAIYPSISEPQCATNYENVSPLPRDKGKGRAFFSPFKNSHRSRKDTIR